MDYMTVRHWKEVEVCLVAGFPAMLLFHEEPQHGKMLSLHNYGEVSHASHELLSLQRSKRALSPSGATLLLRPCLCTHANFR